MLPRHVCRRKIHRVSALAHIKCAAIDRDRFDRRGNQKIGIAITVTMSVSGKIVRKQKIADLEKLPNGLAMVASHSGCEILRSLYAAGGRFDGQSGYGDGRAGTPRVCIKQLVVDNDAFWKRPIRSRTGRPARDAETAV